MPSQASDRLTSSQQDKASICWLHAGDHVPPSPQAPAPGESVGDEFEDVAVWVDAMMATVLMIAQCFQSQPQIKPPTTQHDPQDLPKRYGQLTVGVGEEQRKTSPVGTKTPQLTNGQRGARRSIPWDGASEPHAQC